MNGKKLKGQFFTTNSDYILSGLSKYVRGKNIIDPFAGDKDLIRWAKKYQAKKIIGYDIDAPSATASNQLNIGGLIYGDINGGKVGIGTTTPSNLLDIYSTATTTFKIDSSSTIKGSCLKLKDSDGSGYTYCAVNDGAMNCSSISCE